MADYREAFVGIERLDVARQGHRLQRVQIAVSRTSAASPSAPLRKSNGLPPAIQIIRGLQATV